MWLLTRYAQARETVEEHDERLACYGAWCRERVEDPALRAGCPFLLLYYYKIRRRLPARAARVRDAVRGVLGFDPEEGVSACDG